jgi:hypothetical protein
VAQLSFRDRFYSRSVAEAVTSPSAILALGAGAAVGLLVAPVGVPLGILGAVVGGALGYGGRVALAIPRNAGRQSVDPFSIEEPWRSSVVSALRAQARFDEAVRTLAKGPLRDHLSAIGSRIEEAVAECTKVAQRGQIVSRARKGISDSTVRNELNRVTRSIAADTPGTATQQATIASLQSQLATAARMDSLISSTREQLDLLNARLDESVTQAIELSVSDDGGSLDPLGNDVAQIVSDLSSLRMAMEDVDHGDPTEAVDVAAIAQPADTPPPLPGTEPGDGMRTTPSP